MSARRDCFAYFVLIAVLASSASAFFWTNTQETKTQIPQYYYTNRLMAPSGYAMAGAEQVPSIPVQVPLQAQFAPANSVHNVQLVPCLCPVSQDYNEYEKVPQENIFHNPNNVGGGQQKIKQ